MPFACGVDEGAEALVLEEFFGVCVPVGVGSGGPLAVDVLFGPVPGAVFEGGASCAVEPVPGLPARAETDPVAGSEIQPQ